MQELGPNVQKPALTFQVTSRWKQKLPSGDTVELRVQGQKRTLSFSEPFEAGVSGVTFQEITCAGRGNCKATRAQNVTGKSRKTKHLTRALASGAQTLIGERVVFAYSARREQFSFHYIRYKTLKNEDVGYEVSCER